MDDRKIHLFVDDLRQAPKGWVLARTITEAIRILHELKVEEVSLDHDIVFVDESGQWVGKVNQENFTAVARFIADMPDEHRPKRVRVHSSNPNGRASIISILKDKVPDLAEDFTYAHQWTDSLCRDK